MTIFSTLPDYVKLQKFPEVASTTGKITAISVSRKNRRDKNDFELILKAYQYRGYDKGARSIHMHLLHMGVRMNIKKIRRLMKKYGLFCKIRKANPYRRMAKAIKTNSIVSISLKR